jgi:hypothetical protein
MLQGVKQGLKNYLLSVQTDTTLLKKVSQRKIDILIVQPSISIYIPTASLHIQHAYHSIRLCTYTLKEL